MTRRSSTFEKGIDDGDVIEKMGAFPIAVAGLGNLMNKELTRICHFDCMEF